MSQSLYKSSVLPITTRQIYGKGLELDDPWKRLASSVLIQAALDDIQLIFEGRQPKGMFGKDWEFYSGMIGLDATYEDFLVSVFVSGYYRSGKKRPGATDWMDLKGEKCGGELSVFSI